MAYEQKRGRLCITSRRAEDAMRGHILLTGQHVLNKHPQRPRLDIETHHHVLDILDLTRRARLLDQRLQQRHLPMLKAVIHTFTELFTS